MYHLGWTAIGALIIVWVIVDVMATTHGEGGGMINRRLGRALWGLAMAAFRRHRSHKWLSRSGVAVTMISAVTWILLLWVGWSLVFFGDSHCVVASKDHAPADLWERVYFAGFTIFTLGTGDFKAQGDAWRLASATGSITGFFLVTFAISYLIPVAQAATEKRKLGLGLATLGATPTDMLANAWAGGDLASLEKQLPIINEELALLQQRYVTYPVLHYFHSRNARNASALGVAALDDALTIAELGMDDEVMDPTARRTTQRLVTGLLETLGKLVDDVQEPPPAPDLGALRRAGLPVVDQETFEERLVDVSDRRCLLLSMVQGDGWDWSEMASEHRAFEGDSPRKDKAREEG